MRCAVIVPALNIRSSPADRAVAQGGGKIIGISDRFCGDICRSGHGQIALGAEAAIAVNLSSADYCIIKEGDVASRIDFHITGNLNGTAARVVVVGAVAPNHALFICLDACFNSLFHRCGI